MSPIKEYCCCSGKFSAARLIYWEAAASCHTDDDWQQIKATPPLNSLHGRLYNADLVLLKWTVSTSTAVASSMNQNLQNTRVERMVWQTFITWSFLLLHLVHLGKEIKAQERCVFFLFLYCNSRFEWVQHLDGRWFKVHRAAATWSHIHVYIHWKLTRHMEEFCAHRSHSPLPRTRPLTSDLYPPQGPAKVPLGVDEAQTGLTYLL